MGTLSPQVLAAMKARAEAVKQRIQSGGAGFSKRWDLTGKNTIVEAGGEVVMRLGPRWDIAQKWLVKDGKATLNPAYQEGEIFLEAVEHWWDGPDGKVVREWCLKIFDSSTPCPICEGAEYLKGSADPEDKKIAQRIRPQEVFLFNALKGPVGSRSLGEDKKADIRYLPTPGTVFLAITNIMTGGETESFARGDISDPSDGYDIKISRPAAQGDRYKVDCAPDRSRLFADSEREAFKGVDGAPHQPS